MKRLLLLATSLILLATVNLKAQSVNPNTEIIIGEGTGISGNIPTNTYYKYSYTQQIYTASEMGGSSMIDKIYFQYTYSNSDTRNVDIYLGNTTKEVFASNTDYVPVSEMLLVYSGSVTFNNSSDWFEIVLDSPFVYDGISNIVVAFDDNTGSYQYSGDKFKYHSASDNKSLYVCSDQTNFDPLNPGSGTQSQIRNNIMFSNICTTADCCFPPAFAVAEVQARQMTFTFEADDPETALVFEYKRKTDDVYTVIENVTSSPFTLTGLTPSTQYDIRAKALCSETTESIYVNRTFVTPSVNLSTIYVDADAEGLRDGSSWENALDNLGAALLMAEMIKQDHASYPEIWVAAGTYYGDGTSTNAFIMAEGVNVYGGFAGTETSLEQRDAETNITILDGQGTQRVLYQDKDYTEATATVWDGFTIHNGGGILNGMGAYIYDYGTLRNCVIRNNGIETLSTTAEIKGGGVCVEGGTMDNCKVYGNVLKNDTSGYLRGAGVYMSDGRIVDCEIYGNENYNSYSPSSYSHGGGLYISKEYNYKTLVVENTYVHDNSSRGIGGGMYVDGYNSNGRANIINCRIENNISQSDGGGLYLSRYVNVVGCNIANNTSSYNGGGICAHSYNNIINCNIVNNLSTSTSTSRYGGLHIDNYQNNVTNSIVWGNKRGDGSVSNCSADGAIVSYSAVQGGYPGTGNISLSALNTGDGLHPKFTNPTTGAGAEYSGGDWTIQEGSAVINKGVNEITGITLPENDLAGNTRIQKEKVDIGAYETSYESEFEIVPDANNIIYVTTTGAGSKNGSSWENATPYLNMALSEGGTMSTKPTIWVAAGTYTGDTTTTNAFRMVEGVSVYGGFEGTETSLEDRDYEANVTILDGQNSQRVLCQNNAFTEETATVWDGFTIQNGGGILNGMGAYIYDYGTLRNCVIWNNGSETMSTTTDIYGGGVYVNGGTLDNCKVYGNVLKNDKSGDLRGAGVYMSEGHIVDCEIYGNENYNSYSSSYSYGGGLYINKGSNDKESVVENTYVHDNSSRGSSGGMYVDGYSSNRRANIINCRIENNISQSEGGGLYLSNYVNVVGCNIANNKSTSYGGGIHASSSSYNNIINCNIVKNTSAFGDGIYGSPTVTNCIVWGNDDSQIYSTSQTSSVTYSAVQGGYVGTGNINLSALNTGEGLHPKFTNPTEGVGPDYSGGDWTIQEGSAAINKGKTEGLSVTLPEKDLAGNTRIQNGKIDIGAYETSFNSAFEIVPDTNNIIYVTTTGAGSKNGSSWDNATPYLNVALSETSTMATKPTVWVAAGTYKGDGISTNAFTMTEGVNVYGGFAGTETSLEQRDAATNVTILDGQGTQRVLYQDKDYTETTAAVWDGFTIQNGGGILNGRGAYIKAYATLRNCIITKNGCDTLSSNNDRKGGGVYVDDGTLEYCQIFDNHIISTTNAKVYGGGVFMTEGQILNCEIYDNECIETSPNVSTADGGGVYIENHSSSKISRIENCNIHDNNTSGAGGGVFVRPYNTNYKTEVINCRIENNIAEENGGGVFMTNSTTMIGCIIANNTATANGGGVYVGDSKNNQIINCSVVNNTTAASGGGISSLYYPTITNTIVWGNKRGTSSSQLYFNGSSQPTITYSAIEGGFAGTGNINLSSDNLGNSSESSYPMFSSPSEGAGHEYSGGNWTLLDGSACVDNGVNEITGVTIPEKDLAGNDRIYNDKIDIGAYESAFEGLFITPDANNIIYVATEESGEANGSSWANATSNLQMAINRAATFAVKPHVWVKAGTYGNEEDGDYYIAIAEGVEIYGGFAGTETALEQRDLSANYTILDGKNKKRVLHQANDFKENTTAVIDGFVIQNGKSSNGAGALLRDFAIIRNCIIRNNTATTYRSAIEANGYIKVINCLIADNNSSGSNGYSVYLADSTLFVNNTVVNNINSSNSRAGVYVSGSKVRIYNSILWGNTSDEIYVPNGPVDIRNTAVEGGYSGIGVINLNSENTGDNGFYPCFTDPENGDYTLAENSICINKGSSTVYELPTKDLNSNERVQQGAVDLGAYESAYEPAISITPDANNIIYVTTTGAGSKDGSSWADAANNLQLAIDLANIYGAKVWVKGGLYQSTSNSNYAFRLAPAVEVYGGFAGNESHDYDLSQRDFITNATIIDGGGTKRVLHQESDFTETTAALWDGFTLRNGYDNEYYKAAGAYIQDYVTLRNFIIYDNVSENGYAAGIRVDANNHSLIDNSVIRDNKNYAYSHAGGAYIAYAKITNTKIYNNETKGEGGGLYLGASTMVNCLVSNNKARLYSGVEASSGNIVNSTIVKNSSEYNYNATYPAAYLNNSTVVNSIIWGNTHNGEYAQLGTGNTVDVTYSAIQGGWAGEGNISIEVDNDGNVQDANYIRFLDGANNIFELKDNSVAVDAGNNENANVTDYDLNGKQRVNGATIDMGAFEQHCVKYRHISKNLAQGGSVNFYGSVITEPGQYQKRWALDATCDSLVVMDVRVSSSVIYVTATGAGSKDGSSWDNAMDNINDAVMAAFSQSGVDSRQVWVAAGTYSGYNSSTRFPMVSGVEVYGGFAGTETLFSERDVENNKTILDGANSYNVLDKSTDNPATAENPAIWDGFCINGYNAVINNHCILRNSEITVKTEVNGGMVQNCTITNLQSGKNFKVKASSTVKGCRFFDNSSSSTPLIELDNAVLDSCFVYDNSATRNLIKSTASNIEKTQIYKNTSKYSMIDATETNITNSLIFNNAVNGNVSGFIAIVHAKDNSAIINSNLMNNMVTCTGGGGVTKLDNDEDHYWQYKNVIVALESSDMKNSVVWNNAISSFDNNFIAKDNLSNVDYCAVDGALYNGVGNIRITEANESGLFSPRFVNPIMGLGNVVNQDTYDWSLKANSILFGHADDGKAIGAMTSDAASVMTLNPTDGVIYVSAEGAGLKDGSSWSNATPYLQYAVAMANTFDPIAEVWVKAGTYYGDSIVGNNAFNIVENVNVYGGFAGTETSVEDRDLENNKSILDGQNVQRVLFQNEPFADGETTTWDGFVIRNGYLNQKDFHSYNSVYYKINDLNGGIGIYHLVGAGAVVLDNTTLKNITFENNRIDTDASLNQYVDWMMGSSLAMVGATADNINISNAVACTTDKNNVKSSYLYAANSNITNSTFKNNIGKIQTYGSTLNYCVIEGNRTFEEMPDKENNLVTIFEPLATTVKNTKIISNKGATLLKTNVNGVQYANTYINTIIADNEGYTVVNHSLANGDKFINCDIVSNKTSVESSAGKMVSGGEFHNTVVWNNRNSLGVSSDLDRNNLDKYSFNNCAVELGLDGIDEVIALAPSNSGTSQAYVYANFISPEGNNYELADNSALIDAGDNSVVTEEFDLNGKERIGDGTVDIGAIESSCVLKREYNVVTMMNEYPFYGEWLTEPGTYIHRKEANNDCDSVIVMHLTFKRLVYVNAEAKGLNNGTSWENAYTDLKMACDSIEDNGNLTEMWVAKGRYRGDGTSVNAFILKPNTRIYGGFTGTELADYDITQRDITANETILDGGYIQRVICMEKDATEETPVIIDGFTITKGFSRQGVSDGTALYVKQYCYVSNCIITDNCTNSGVGPIHIDAANFENCNIRKYINTFENCDIHHNQGSTVIHSENTLFSNCKIENNDGLGIDVASYTMLDGCSISNNKGRAIFVEFGGEVFADEFGYEKITISYQDVYNTIINNNAGGIYHEDPGFVGGWGDGRYYNTVISNNRVTKVVDKQEDGNGGAFRTLGGKVSLYNCNIVNNSAKVSGGGLYGKFDEVINTIIYGNRANGEVSNLSNYYYFFDMETQILKTWQGLSDLRYCAVEAGYPGEGNISLNKDYPLSMSGNSLTSNSVCVNAGTDALYDLTEYDLKGKSRVLNGRVDIGAEESNYSREDLITPDANNVIYVDVTAKGSKDGSSWNNATADVQTAINYAATMEPRPEIWMKKGVYTMPENEGWAMFTIIPGTKIYGGFAGDENPVTFNKNDRELFDNKTVLDAKNLLRAIDHYTATNDYEKSVIDGFTIKNGNAEPIYTKRIPSSVTSFPSEYVGGAIRLKDNVSVTNCDIYNNVADKGGAIYANNYDEDMNILISNSKFHDNYAHEEGGAIVMSRNYIYQNTQHDSIINCEISNNKSDRFAGLNINWTKVLNSTIVGNNTEMYAFDTLTSTNHNNKYYNCILWNNVSRNYSNQIEGYDNTYEYCAIHGGYTGEGNITLDKYNSGTEEGVNYVNFIDPEGRAYQPQNTSAVIDKGNNTYSVGDFDLAGKDRIYNEIVDLGAYEGGCIGYRHMKVIANEKYVFYGDTLRESGHYSKQWTPAGTSCDSLVTLDLEVRKIWFVTVTGAGKKDGSSWTDAMSDIQEAINKAAAFQTEAKKQIWVAKGTYMGNGSSTQAFQIKAGVEIYGGFAGNEMNGIEFEDRDLVTNETILSGANSQRVLGNYNAHSSFNVNDNAVIDGFTIQDGYTPKEGGGIYVKNFVKVRNCIIKNNQGGDGAGIYADNKCEITDCKIYGNVALSKGGGAFCKSSTLTYCEINNNLIDNLTGSAKQGGGIYGENATINNCLIANNSVLTETSYGGGMYIGSSSLPSQLLNCTMVNNFSYYLGGGVYSVNSGSNNEFINCIMWGNKTDLNTQQVAVSASNVPIYVRYCAIQGGAAGIGTINLTAENGDDMFSPRFVNPTEQVGANYWGGDWRIKDGSICINMGERLEYMIEQDLDDEVRVKQDRIDIGAYETNETNSFRIYPDGNNIIYVKKDNAGSDMTGSSWNNAINDLQLALNFAADDDNHPKVWIAKGTYTGNGWPYVDAFIGLNGIDIYGGFAGNEAHDYDLSQRDLVNNATVLDGQNIQRTLHQAHNTHFKYSLDPMHYAIYDGLVIRNGFVYHNYGGNVVMRKGELRNSIIENGVAIYGNMLNMQTNCGGAGIVGTSSDITVINSVIRNNKTISADGGGYYGAMTFRNCLINNNSATVEEQYGSGYAYGGAGTNTDDARYPFAKHYNSTIVNNYAHSGVGGISNYDFVYNSILWGNKIDGNITSNLKLTDVAGNISYGRTEVYYSAVEGGCVGNGNITLNADNSGSDDVNYPMFVNPTIAVGAGNYGAGDWRLQDGSVCVNRGTTTTQITDLDLDGNTRIVNDSIDMGAYESNFGINHEIIPDANDIVYVTTTGAGTKDGSSWANATPYLQFAMDRIYQYERPIKFWIAKGTYKGNGVASNPAFIMTDNVSLYGGFAGNEEANFDLSLRDFETNETVFDGQNLQQVLARDLEFYSSNSRNRIDGVTIKNGRFTEEGAGARLNKVDVYHSTFTNNTNLSETTGGGGALYTNDVAIYYSKFFNNYSTNNGGAIYSQGSNDIISHCLIKNNTADNDGGGIYGGTLKIYNSEISYNTADNGGGICATGSSIVNSTIVNNNASAVSEGRNAGGIYGGSIYNSIIWGNRAGSYVSNVRGKIFYFQYSACERDEYVPDPATNIILETSNSGDNIALNYVSFIDPANGDFQLMENSDCIDKGNKDLTNQHDIDLAGNERIRGANIDMGAYEQNPTSCKMISDLSVPEDKITFTTVDVTWTSNGTEAEWLVYYDRVGENSPTLMTVDTTYITIDSLSPNLEYFVKVRAICSEIEMSPYSNPVNFTTECHPDSVVWVNHFETDNLLPEIDQALQANSRVLFSWDHIEGAESYELWLWRADDGHGLPIPDFPVAYNIKNNYHTVDLRASAYQGYGKYPRSLSKPEPPGYLEQTPEEDIAYYAWKVVAYRECAAIETDTMYFNTALSDLHITAMDCSYAQTGQPMTVRWTVRNDGHGPTPVGETWYDYIVLSYPIDWTSESFTQVPYESFIMERVENLTALQVGESYENEKTIFVPDDMYGGVILFVLSNWNPNTALGLNFSQYGGVFPDPYTPNLYGDGIPYGFMSGNNSKAGNASFEEINGVDNFFYKAIEVDIPPIPDMIATNVIPPYEHFAGDSITISWQLINQGGAAFEDIPVTDNIYMSTKNVFDADARMLGAYRDTISMERNDTLTRIATFVTNEKDIDTFYFYVETDVRNQVYESLFEHNNVSFCSEHPTVFMPIPPADLTIENIVISSDTLSPNEKFNISYTVKNIGYKNTNESSQWTVDTCGNLPPTYGKPWRDVIYISTEPEFNKSNAKQLASYNNNKILWTLDELKAIADTIDLYVNCKFPDIMPPDSSAHPDEWNLYWQEKESQDLKREALRHEKTILYTNSYSVQKEVTIPEEYNGGLYYIHILTDQGDNIFEYNAEENNAISDTARVVLPDLYVYGLTLNESRDTATYIVKNIGYGKIIDGLMSNTVNYNNAQILYEMTPEVNLNPNDSLIMKLPIHLECNFYTDNTLKVETRLIYNEDTYTNNNQTVDLQLFNPDFFAEGLTIPATQLGSGETYELTYTITNNGDVDFNDTVNIRYYLGLSPELNFITAEELLSKDEPVSLAIGETVTITENVTLPISADGLYYFYVSVNDDENICEGDNTYNNYLVSELLNVSLSPYPDFVVSYVSMPEEAMAGSPITLSYTVENRGTRATFSSEYWVDKIYISSEPQFNENNATLLETVKRSGTIDVNSLYTMTVEVPISANIATGQYIYIMPDANDDVFEYVYENNNLYQTSLLNVVLYNCDLEATSISCPDILQWGTSVNFSYEVTNKGTKTTTAAVYYQTIYLSTDESVDAGDIELGNIAGKRLSGGESQSGNVNITIPYGFIGNAYILLVADPGGKNPDVNINNNVISRAVNVENVPVPDLAISNVNLVTEYPAAGQPIRIAYTVTNIGDGEATSWKDKVLYSRNTYKNGTLAETKERNFTLAQGQSYNDTTEVIIPLPNTGNFAIYIDVNAPIGKENEHSFFEMNYENNLGMQAVNVDFNPPGDLLVDAISHPYVVVSGDDMEIKYHLRNLGPNLLEGQGCNDVFYLSTDQTFSPDDVLLGNLDHDIVLPNYSYEEYSFTANISGVPEGEYYIIIYGDARNSFYEVDENNNRGYSAYPFEVQVPELFFDTPITFKLKDLVHKDFKLNINGNINETVRIHLSSSDAQDGAVNNIYVKHNSMGSNMDYDFSTDGDMEGNAEVYIPTTRAGYYGISVMGNAPLDDEQEITIEANILPFEIRSVEANVVGNTGKVTVKLIGSKFRYDMPVRLFMGDPADSTMYNIIEAEELHYINFNEVCVTFDLTGAEEGVYSIEAYNYCAGYTYLMNSFMVVAGLPENLSTNLIIPEGLRQNRYCILTLEYGNIGNTDIVDPKIKLVSLGGSWIGLERGEINVHRTELDIPIGMEGEPEGILRPGVRYTVSIYCFTNQSLEFVIYSNDDIYHYEQLRDEVIK
ncbi:MAG: right-handed parallel beta-helix repeat-containing protein [Bacteroidales bacterium]|nr:right-handed parallel beta-helix repeat-containing protein [Bacteroidales bacterium]